MNAAVADLLAACGVSNARDTVPWRRVLLVNNVGGVPGEDARGDVVASRGFNLIVLDEGGAPTLFCKCRPASAGWNRGSALVAQMSGIPELATVVAPTWSVHSDMIDAEVSRYLRGELLERRIRSMTAVQLGVALDGILAAAARLATHAARVEPQLAGGLAGISLSDEASWIMPAVVDAGLASADAGRLEAALACAGTLPRCLQHGDLWPRNALEADGHWHLLDFEMYGRVQVPLYDAFHLVRTSWDARAGRNGAHRAWLDGMRSNGADNDVFRATIGRAARKAGLSAAQVGGALVYYVVHFAASLYRRGILARDVEPYMFEVSRLAEWIADGRRPDELLLPTRQP